MKPNPTIVAAIQTILEMRCNGFSAHLSLHFERQEDYDLLAAIVSSAGGVRDCIYSGGEYRDFTDIGYGEMKVTMFGPGRPGELPAGVVDIRKAVR